MKTLRIRDTGPEVKTLQKLLNRALGSRLEPDGKFGQATQDAVEDFQEDVQLYADGIVGPDTWAALRALEPQQNFSSRLTWAVAPADKYKGGYSRFTLREDVAQAYEKVRAEAREAGAIVTSSGGKRGLGAKVSTGRSATSLHYTGRALDLYLYSGMVNPREDPYVVVPDPDASRFWRVYARAEDGERLDLDGYTYKKKRVAVSDRFIDLTALFAKHGFDRIRARRKFFRPGRHDSSAEWWHFQYEKGLVEGKTTFGDELLRVYTVRHLTPTSPWKSRERTWGVDWG